MNLRQQQAMSLLNAGLSIVPIRPDGTKAAAVKWERYQAERATEQDVLRWFTSMHSGIGIIGGVISGGLEMLDFDDAEVFEPWLNLVNQIYEDITTDMPVVETPTGGFHVYYRAHHISGNQKLARRRPQGMPLEVRIETRGEGGYVLSPYCHVDCHPLRRGYEMIRGDITTIPLISRQAREVLLNSAKAFDEVIDPPKRHLPKPTEHESDRPGDVFNATRSWEEVLEPHGWKAVHHSGQCTLWKRPGKDEHGWSARTGYKDYATLRVFSTNAYPFEENRSYSKFHAFALLNFRGDFSAAAKSLLGRVS